RSSRRIRPDRPDPLSSSTLLAESVAAQGCSGRVRDRGGACRASRPSSDQNPTVSVAGSEATPMAVDMVGGPPWRRIHCTLFSHPATISSDYRRSSSTCSIKQYTFIYATNYCEHGW